MTTRAVFLLEQHIGHRTYSENLKHAVNADARIVPTWVPITYSQTNGFYERLTFLPNNVRGTLRGRAQAQAGLNCVHDVAFFNTQVPAALAGAKIFDRPFIISTDITPLQYDRMGKLYGHRADRLAFLRDYKHRTNVRVFRNAARIAPWSSWVAQSLVEEYGVDAKRIEVVPPGIDLERWMPSTKKFDDGKLHILFVGGDLYRKGGKVLLDAFAQLRREYGAHLELDMVTRSPSPQAENVVGVHNLQANDPRLIELYRQCDFFVLPTEAEAFGIAAIEASAAGLPVIASQVGGLVDVVDDGVTGFLVPPGDVNALAEKMRWLIENANAREKMGRAARQRAEEKFDAHKNGEHLVEILLRAAK